MEELLLNSLNNNGRLVYRLIMEGEEIPRGFSEIDASIVVISCPACGEISVKKGKVVLEGVEYLLVSAPKTWWRKR